MSERHQRKPRTCSQCGTLFEHATAAELKAHWRACIAKPPAPAGWERHQETEAKADETL